MRRREALAALLGLAAGGCGGRPGARIADPPWQTQAPATEGSIFTAAVPYVPTRPEVVDAMLALGAVTGRDVVYDLGCGDGRIVIAAAKRFGARGLGVEIDRELVSRAIANAQWEGVADRAKFALQDLFDLDLRPATVVMLYLSVEINVRLRPRLLAQLRPGSRIVSNRFDMADAWRPERTVVVSDTPVHLWRIPA
jgi:SAM-dependent methyltransferase